MSQEEHDLHDQLYLRSNGQVGRDAGEQPRSTESAGCAAMPAALAQNAAAELLAGRVQSGALLFRLTPHSRNMIVTQPFDAPFSSSTILLARSN